MSTAIFPEIIEQAFKNKEIDDLIIWIILKSYDNLTNGDGKLAKDTIKHILKKYSQSSIYRFLSKNIFWNKNKDDYYLFGLKSICQKYDIHILSTGYLIPIKYFYSCNLKQQKALLFSIAMSKTNNPQSYINISERCSISRRTAIEYIKICPAISKIKNYCYISSFKKNNEYFNSNESKATHIVKDGGGYHIVKQMPNSYKIEIWDESSPKALNRKIKSSSLSQTEPNRRIYGKNDTSNAKYIFKGIANVGTFCEEWNSFQERKDVNMWFEKEII